MGTGKFDPQPMRYCLARKNNPFVSGSRSGDFSGLNYLNAPSRINRPVILKRRRFILIEKKLNRRPGCLEANRKNPILSNGTKAA
jgi:hypothetical protein